MLKMNSTIELLAGEKAIENAPPIELSNGQNCIPQHYLIFEHTLESVEKIVIQIEFDDKFPIFVSEDSQGIYIQIGIVGYDNFLPRSQQYQRKIVYGRRWRVEQQLPTSEIIQTIFLAIKTAREHELRELFQLQVDGRQTTPFNNHHDLPLMSRQRNLIVECGVINQPIDIRGEAFIDIQLILNLIEYDASTFRLINCQPVTSQQWIIELKIERTHMSELEETKIDSLSFIIKSLSENELLHSLMSSLIELSNLLVEEGFFYDGFARFSRHNHVKSIARLSSKLRAIDHIENKQLAFMKNFEQRNYDTDITRVPKIQSGPLADKLRNSLQKFGKLAGLLPN